MSLDASFEKIDKIIPHSNADKLEIAIISRNPCIVQKGEFKEGEIVFYIRDDAKLVEYDNCRFRRMKIGDYKNMYNNGRMTFDTIVRKLKDISDDKDFSSIDNTDIVMSDKDYVNALAEIASNANLTFGWQDNLLKFLGAYGRVKSIRLRGEDSVGIVLKATTVCEPSFVDFTVTEENLDEINDKIRNEETGAAFLEKNFGVVHFVNYNSKLGTMNVKSSSLPSNIKKTDEENFENIRDSDLHIGARCLVTKKFDGTSTTIVCYPNGNYDICSRSQTINVDKMIEKGETNVYMTYSTEAVKAGLWWAKKHNETIAIRGETCCPSVQSSSYNSDCNRGGFFVYSCEFPNETDYFKRYGTLGTDNHFLKIVDEMNNEGGFNVKTVDIIGYDTVSMEMLKEYRAKPWTWGEGVVLNIDYTTAENKESKVWHYKSKSRDYLMKMK